MENQLFMATYYDPEHQRINFYSSVPLANDAVMTMAYAYRVLEAQFLSNPIFIIYDEGGMYKDFGVKTWGDNISLISPKEMKAMKIDQTSMFCVNRPFLNMIDDIGDKDMIDAVGGITHDVIEAVWYHRTCFIAIVSPEIVEVNILEEEIVE